MNASQHTRYYFENGGIWHAFAGVYLGYRESGRGMLYSALIACHFGLWTMGDWIREVFVTRKAFATLTWVLLHFVPRHKRAWFAWWFTMTFKRWRDG